jgi:hypothetical protein
MPTAGTTGLSFELPPRRVDLRTHGDGLTAWLAFLKALRMQQSALTL